MAEKKLHDLIDSTIHQRTRLSIMATLTAVGRLEFTELRSELGLTDGNLSTHIAHLERAGYVEINKTFKGKKPNTEIILTPKGRKAIKRYLALLDSILTKAR